MGDSPDRFFAVVVNGHGARKPVIRGFDKDLDAPLELTFRQVGLIKHSHPFIEKAANLLAEKPSSFWGEIEFDVYPLMVFWDASDADSGVVTIQHIPTAWSSLTYLAKTNGPVPDGAANVFSGMSAIEDLAVSLASFPMRPLSFTSEDFDSEVAIAAKLSNTWSNNHSAGEEIIAAARLSFAAAYFQQHGEPTPAGKA
jgi:hypothetical protein